MWLFHIRHNKNSKRSTLNMSGFVFLECHANNSTPMMWDPFRQDSSFPIFSRGHFSPKEKPTGEIELCTTVDGSEILVSS